MNEEEKLQLLATEQMEILEPQIIDFLYRYYGKPYVLDRRIKSTSKLKLKQKLFSDQKGYPVALEDLPDIIGFRISVESEAEVEEISELIKQIMRPNKVIDYFNNPKDTWFKAYLYYFENLEVNTEIQIMTEKMKEWTNLTHDEHNIRKYALK